jgi:type IV pilus assembly protein PilO
MSFSEEYVPGDQGQIDAAAGINLFGTTISPLVLGVVAAILGLVGAIYLGLQQVKPVLDQNQTLQTEIDGLEQQVNQQKASLGQIAEAQANLDSAKARKEALLAFFAPDEVLDTLLIDFEKMVRQQPGLKLKKFSLTGQSEVIADGSLGETANGRFKRQAVAMEIEANFDKTKKLLQAFERFKPIVQVTQLSVTREGENLGSLRISESGRVTVVDADIKLTTTLSLQVIAARSQKEIDEEAAQKAAEEAAAAAAAGAPAETPPPQ